MATFTPFDTTIITASLTLSVTAYTSGDQVSAEIVLPAVAGDNNGYGVITGIQITDDGDVTGAIDLFIFSDSTTPAADNAVAAWSDPDALKAIVGQPVLLPGPQDLGGVRTAGVDSRGIQFRSGSGHDDLFVNIVTRSGHSFFVANDDLHIRFVGYKITF